MEVLERIRQVIDTSVRPYLQGHGGDIQILDFTDGVLKFKLTGMCSIVHPLCLRQKTL